MQTEEENAAATPALGRVRDIRKQWAVHEDEALAYRLQNEEISQHYSGNKIRNAIVREDAPRAREAQRQEEKEALEQRFLQLSVLQKQAEEDERIALMLDQQYKQGYSGGKSITNESLEALANGIILTIGSVEKENGKYRDRPHSSTSLLTRSKSPPPSVPSTSSELFCSVPGPSKRTSYNVDSTSYDINEDRLTQEEKDAELAKRLQEELEQVELDRKLAVEAQDRELAKMLHDKEKARMKRAKERAKLKAEANLSEIEVTTTDDDTASNTGTFVDKGRITPSHPKLSSSNSPLSAKPASPPRVPSKSKSGFDQDDPVKFRASPKALPPQPEDGSNRGNYARSADPVPPYMPLQGLNRTKRHK